jgi:hypothetical protein
VRGFPRIIIGDCPTESVIVLVDNRAAAPMFALPGELFGRHAIRGDKNKTQVS